ncbi:Transmembrane 9 superfamily member [Fasciola gigantica]|uniref:Transmembrane 9 superfamily member n=1 Tax=Fasciola gigantica TaxID=46835 RepID=A0A504Y716_FASGI|nr:Transmembrane 9 superfamily member [Fasciola gigantica]
MLQYSHHWVVDNLPVIVCLQRDNQRRYCTSSVPLGCFGDTSDVSGTICASLVRSKNDVYLFNHYHFRVLYHQVKDSWSDEGLNRVISVLVEPRSISHPKDSPDCSSSTPLILPDRFDSDLAITYTYSVVYEPTEYKWASRWDYILDTMPESKIQWISILNSVVLVLFLSALVATILLRTLRRDIARYSQLESSSEVQEESGWKLVHGDVFRPPAWGMLLCVLLGSGSQLFLMVLVTLFFACLGFLSPANRGSLMTCALAMYACSGILAGYVSARMYKFIGGLRWKANVFLTATLCPGVVFVMFFILNLALWIVGSASATPFGTIVALLALWLCVSLPLCFVGALFGFRKHAIEVPVRTNQIPRQIPFLTTYSRPVITFFLGGLLPFSCIFIQLFFIFNTLWGNQFYFMFGLLFLVFLMLALTCSETAILLCYFQLCSEDYRWWWRAFHCGAGTSFYLFIYSIHYFVSRLEFRDATSGFLYFGYILIIVWLSFLLTGTIGYMACLWFVRKIYSVVKVD